SSLLACRLPAKWAAYGNGHFKRVENPFPEGPLGAFRKRVFSTCNRGPQTRRSAGQQYYFSSTLAPAPSSCALSFSASSLAMPSLTAFGAPSTRSLASFRPRPVIARTSLITLILFAPASARMTSNSVFSSTAGAAAPPAAAATATGAAAETPHFSSSIL